jgi:hypothetical protein
MRAFGYRYATPYDAGGDPRWQTAEATAISHLMTQYP